MAPTTRSSAGATKRAAAPMTPEGVRIIEPTRRPRPSNEATRSKRKADDEPKYGDRPAAAADGARPTLRFPLADSDATAGDRAAAASRRSSPASADEPFRPERIDDEPIIIGRAGRPARPSCRTGPSRPPARCPGSSSASRRRHDDEEQWSSFADTGPALARRARRLGRRRRRRPRPSRRGPEVAAGRARHERPADPGRVPDLRRPRRARAPTSRRGPSARRPTTRSASQTEPSPTGRFGSRAPRPRRARPRREPGPSAPEPRRPRRRRPAPAPGRRGRRRPTRPAAGGAGRDVPAGRLRRRRHRRRRGHPLSSSVPAFTMILVAVVVVLAGVEFFSAVRRGGLPARDAARAWPRRRRCPLAVLLAGRVGHAAGAVPHPRRSRCSGSSSGVGGNARSAEHRASPCSAWSTSACSARSPRSSLKIPDAGGEHPAGHRRRARWSTTSAASSSAGSSGARPLTRGQPEQDDRGPGRRHGSSRSSPR